MGHGGAKWGLRRRKRIGGCAWRIAGCTVVGNEGSDGDTDACPYYQTIVGDASPRREDETATWRPQNGGVDMETATRRRPHEDGHMKTRGQDSVSEHEIKETTESQYPCVCVATTCRLRTLLGKP